MIYSDYPSSLLLFLPLLVAAPKITNLQKWIMDVELPLRVGFEIGFTRIRKLLLNPV